MKLLVGSLFLLLLTVDAQHALDNLSAEDGNVTAELASETSSLNDTTIAKQKYKKGGIFKAIAQAVIDGVFNIGGQAVYGWLSGNRRAAE
ncbi:hypothetical protein Aduo_016653 [Ancylostoma duodenale]